MGVSKEPRQMQLDLAREERDLFRRLFQSGEERVRRGEQLQQPAIDIAQAILYGDESAIARALAVPAETISRQMRQAKENIYAYSPAGAGREYALAQLGREGPTEMARLASQIWQQAPGTLSSIGQFFTGLGTTERQLGWHAGESARAAIADVMRTEAQRKYSTLGLLGPLAELAGRAAFMPLFGTPTPTPPAPITTMPST